MLCPLLTLQAQDEVRVFKTQEYTRNITSNHPYFSENQKQIKKSFKNYIQNGTPFEKNISIIFHNLYDVQSKKVEELKINRQIELLNEYFSNSSYPQGDPSDYNERFIDYYSKENFINFCLVDQSILDDLGSSLNPINYRQITLAEFNIDNQMKGSPYGMPVQYPSSLLNIWIVDLSADNAGFAQIPGGDASNDGIVIDYKLLKDIENQSASHPYVEGKSLMHLIANYLGVNDLWNEIDECGDDGIYDTPIHNAPNYSCYRATHYSMCGTNSEPEMLNNYMDATPDACQYYFTAGQMMMMQSLLDKEGGFRYDLTETECRKNIIDEEQSNTRNISSPSMQLYPNPSSGAIFIQFSGLEKSNLGILRITDIQGRELLLEKIYDFSQPFYKNLRELSSQSIFFIELKMENGNSLTKKVIVQL